MIKSNKGRIKIHGKDNEILADLAIIIHSLYFNEIMTKKTNRRSSKNRI